jgi:hypothetical protein
MVSRARLLRISWMLLFISLSYTSCAATARSEAWGEHLPGIESELNGPHHVVGDEDSRSCRLGHDGSASV